MTMIPPTILLNVAHIVVSPILPSHTMPLEHSGMAWRIMIMVWAKLLSTTVTLATSLPTSIATVRIKYLYEQKQLFYCTQKIDPRVKTNDPIAKDG